MKYIMLKTKLAGIDKLVPVIFPDFMCHIDVDKSIKDLLLNNHKLESETFSAGDIIIDDCSCSGNSQTLEVKSNVVDTQVIVTYDYLHGLVEDES